MKTVWQVLSKVGILAVICMFSMISVVSAHVVVKPAEVVTAGFQTFTIGVPNEKDMPTTSIKLVMPADLHYVSPTQKVGWNIVVEKDGMGEDATVRSITWQGGSINAGYRDDFTFSAQVPDKPTELHWKAYQTYEDGTVVSWDQAGEREAEGENTGPFSVTKVVTTTQADAALQKNEQMIAKAEHAANRSLYIGVAGVIVGLVGVYLATRKRNA